MIKKLFSLIIFIVIPCVAHTASDEQIKKLVAWMIEEIEADVKSTSGAIGKSALDKQVMKAMSDVPRHEFVKHEYRHYAYYNRPLPIGYGQTISQPFIVALMTDLLGLDEDDTVLEIGTGSGYQAAILSEVVKKVYTVEIIEPLGRKAKERLQRLGYDNVEVSVRDGYYGWKEHAPFDGIIVTCAAGHVPPLLLDQLKPGGKIVIPIGGPYKVQILMVITKDSSGKLKTRQIIPVRFVPMTGQVQKAE